MRGGTLPAPLFLFLAGISFALVTDKLQKKGTPPNVIARTTIRRGAEILGLGLLFRVQEYVIAWGWAPWSDLLRVDILNTIGISMILMGVVCWIVLNVGRTSRIRQVLGLTAGGVALLISSGPTAVVAFPHLSLDGFRFCRSGRRFPPPQ